jgi:hypothetical protein
LRHISSRVVPDAESEEGAAVTPSRISHPLWLRVAEPTARQPRQGRVPRLVKKALEVRHGRVIDRAEPPPPGDGRPRRWKAPRVRLTVSPFARRHERRPYKAGRASVRQAGRVRSRGAVTARPLGFAVLHGGARHGLVTGGARVSQVGVNPPWQAVVAVGVEKANSRSDPWPEEARWVKPCKGWGHSVARRLAAAIRVEVWAIRERVRGALRCRSR